MSVPETPVLTHAGVFEVTGTSGVSLARAGDVLGIRLVFPNEALGLFDGKDLPLSICTPPVQAPDLSYVRYQWRVPIRPAGIRRYASWPRKMINAPHVIRYAPGEAATMTLEWQFDGKTVRGRYTSDQDARFALLVNGCFRPARVLAASHDCCQLQQNDTTLRLCLRGQTETPLVLNTAIELQQAWAGLKVQRGESFVAYPATIGPDRPLTFCMSFEDCAPAEVALDDAAYEQSRMRSTGSFAGAAEAVASLSAYGRAYDPKRQMLQTTVNRTWGGVNSPGIIFGWDNFFTSYLAAWEDPALAASSLEHVVTTYGENGIAHGPVQRNLIIPVMYCRTIHLLGDYELAGRTWDTMMAFMRFWFVHRDGNGDGLIESGASADPLTLTPGRLIQEAMDETGYDEIPIYSAGFTDGRQGMLAPGVRFDWQSRCLTVTLVCQNSLYIAACHAMKALGTLLGKESDVGWLESEAKRVDERMRERLFCETDGLFRDRFWEGEFSPVRAMTIFYPLLAGIADDSTKARLHEILTDPKQFWGDSLIPTVSRSDPSYCDGLDKRGNYWRGNCWPPTTYIVGLAAKEAGWDETVASYGCRTAAQFMEYWQAHTHAYENYPPQGRADDELLYPGGWGGREIRYTWAGMMLMTGLEEIFGFELDGCLRFGNPYLREQSQWHGFTYQGRRVEAEAGPARTRLAVTGKCEFLAEPGIVVRRCNPEMTRFQTSSSSSAQVTLKHLQGDVLVTVNGKPEMAKTSAGAVSFTLPPGKWEILISRKDPVSPPGQSF